MNTSKKRNLWITASLVISSFITANLCCWLLPGVFEAWNDQTVDRLFAIRSSLEMFRLPYDDTIIHIDLNNTSIQQLGNFYLDRSHHARVITNLAAMGVSAQVFDFIFAAPSNQDHDRKLRDATLEAGTVYYGFAFELLPGTSIKGMSPALGQHIPSLEHTAWDVQVDGDISEWFVGTNPLITFPLLASVSRGLGYLNISSDRDGVFRRLPLLVRYQETFYPSISLRTICDYLNVPPGRITVSRSTLTLTEARRPGERTTCDIVIPLDRYGNMIVNYAGPWERMKHYNYADVLRASEDRDEMELWRDELAGKIAVVSEVSTGTSDIGPVPTDSLCPLSAVHTNVMNTILTREFLRELTRPEMLLIEGTLLVSILILSLCFSSFYFSLSILLVGTLYLSGAGTAFLYGNFILHIVRPLLMVSFALISLLVYRYIKEEKEKNESLRQRDFIRSTFGRYLSNEVVEELLGSPKGLTMTGELREVTFLVSDLRGFTPLTASLPPHEVITILNRFLETMVDIISRYHGTVDEFQGDGILVFFGAPLSAPDDPERAVACALEMQNKMLELNSELTRQNLPSLLMGIGINSGEVVVGNIGSEKRAKYTAVGTPINMTYRIESYTTGGQILISANTYKKVQAEILSRQTMEVQFKGINQPSTLYDVTGIEGTYKITLTTGDPHSCTLLAPPLPIRCFLLEGKTVSQKDITGYITSLGAARAEVSLSEAVPNHSNLKVLLEDEKGPNPSPLYAKIVSVEGPVSPSSDTGGVLNFTFLPEDVKLFLQKRLSGLFH